MGIVLNPLLWGGYSSSRSYPIKWTIRPNPLSNVYGLWLHCRLGYGHPILATSNMLGEMLRSFLKNETPLDCRRRSEFPTGEDRYCADVFIRPLSARA